MKCETKFLNLVGSRHLSTCSRILEGNRALNAPFKSRARAAVLLFLAKPCNTSTANTETQSVADLPRLKPNCWRGISRLNSAKWSLLCHPFHQFTYSRWQGNRSDSLVTRLRNKLDQRRCPGTRKIRFKIAGIQSIPQKFSGRGGQLPQNFLEIRSIPGEESAFVSASAESNSSFVNGRL